MPAELTYPRRLTLAPDETRDLYVDFQGYAELTATTGTSQSGETGEGQTISSGTATLAVADGSSPSSPATAGSCVVSGTKLTATVTVPANSTAPTAYTLRFTATTSGNKKLSRLINLDVKNV